MHVETVPNRNSPPAILLRQSFRQGKKVLKRTLANLSHWPAHKIEAFRRLLRDEILLSPEELFRIEASLPHGHVEAVLGTIRKLRLDALLASKRCRERDLVVAMIAERLLFPCSKLATTRLWNTTTLAQELSVQDADENELYAALDWLLARKKAIEKKLAAKHLANGSVALYDLSSSFYYGRGCPLADYGHDRDGKKGLPIITYGILANSEGCPVAVDVYPGHTADSTTVPDQVKKVQGEFGLDRVVWVGDRGMLTQTQIATLAEYPGIGWIAALRSASIRALIAQGHLSRSLFDRQNLAEITSPEFPNERLIACHNPLLAEERRRTRQDLLAATEKALEKISKEVKRRTKTPLSASAIGVKAGKIINRFKMAKHFELKIADGVLRYSRKPDTILKEEQLDGIYCLRTSESAESFSAQQTVRAYKSLAHVERAFRCLKGVDLMVRPIFHRTEDRVRAHIFLCMLAYYVEWSMRQALAPLLFADAEVIQDRQSRDAIAPARPSRSAVEKRARHTTPEGIQVHSFKTLLQALSTRCRNTCRLSSDLASACIQLTVPTPLQAHALHLLGL